jgi:hypothetical protein
MMKKLGAETKTNADKISVGILEPPAPTLQGEWGGLEEMPKRRRVDYKKPEKTYWHIYSLQNLNSEKFIKVVNKILKKEYILIK